MKPTASRETETTTIISLKMSPESASCLLFVLNQVAGPKSGPRGQISELIDALRAASVDPAQIKMSLAYDNLYIDK